MEAAHYQTNLALRVYSSQLLGCHKSLVLHGGGNAPVKIRERNLFGEEEDILYVKGSGWDLEAPKEAMMIWSYSNGCRRTIVSSRSGPVEIMSTGTSQTSSMRFR